MLAYLMLYGTEPGIHKPEGIAAWHIAVTALFLHGFWPQTINLVVPGGWSIAIEMSFYVVFPWLVNRLRGPQSCLLAALAWYVIFSVGVTEQLEQFAYAHASNAWRDVLDGFFYFYLPTQFPVFLIGMAIYRVYAIPLQLPRMAALRLIGIAVAWLLLAAVGKWIYGLDARPFFWGTVFGLALMVGAVLKLRASWLPLAFLGRMSYSVYLLHFAFIEGLHAIYTRTGLIVPNYGSWALALVTVLAVSMAFGELSRRTIERWSSITASWVLRRRTGAPSYQTVSERVSSG
jgi:peptidoglycan/LPS O-acetylase OafA/YrhL